MAGLATLLSLSAVMAIASFTAGLLPLTISLSRSQLRLISTIGMGVLVGTSMIVIIPEGVDTLYSSTTVGQQQQASHMLSGERLIKWSHNRRTTVPDGSLPGVISAAHRQPVPAAFVGLAPTELSTDPITDTTLIQAQEEDTETQHSAHDDTRHAWIGIALIAGFILMFLIDKIPHYTSASKPKPRTHHIALNNLGGAFSMNAASQEPESQTFSTDSQPSDPVLQSRGFATTTGLVIHAAADGIALGASSSSSNTSLSFVIFFAIMVHKAPAAFGLTSILLQQGLSKRLARAHLVVFSLAAPFGAIGTWIVARVITTNTVQNMRNEGWWTGILLLFSAGTFLYVAMHSMQEITDGHWDGSDTDIYPNNLLGEARESSVQEPDKSVARDLGAAVFGMILPLLLQVGHAH